MRVCVLTMQKDEELLLPSFVAYYSALFGPSALHIVDNGSASLTRSMIDEAESQGCTIYRNFSSPQDFKRKGDVVASIVNSLRQRYDVFLTLDCDEFIGVNTSRHGYSCRREDILDELSHFKPDTAYRIHQRLRNHPLDDRRFYDIASAIPKLVFGSARIEGLTVGFHVCTAPATVRNTRLVLFEFHNKPFEHLRRSARDKLKLRLDVSDAQALRNYSGKGAHLPRYLLFSQAEYLNHLASQPWFETPAIHDAFGALGLPHLYGST